MKMSMKQKVQPNKMRGMFLREGSALTNFKQEPLFWQVRIRLTQAPYPFEPKIIAEGSVDVYEQVENFRTFLLDFFGPERDLSYGLEISAQEKIDITFFARVDSKLEALEIGET